MEEIELEAVHGRGDEMLQTTRYVIREIAAQGFDPSMVSCDDFRNRVFDAIDLLRQNGKYENTIDVARSLAPVIDASEALVQEGIGYREWAKATLEEGTDMQGEVSRSASSLARSRYRAAGGLPSTVMSST